MKSILNKIRYLFNWIEPVREIVIRDKKGLVKMLKKFMQYDDTFQTWTRDPSDQRVLRCGGMDPAYLIDGEAIGLLKDAMNCNTLHAWSHNSKDVLNRLTRTDKIENLLK